MNSEWIHEINDRESTEAEAEDTEKTNASTEAEPRVAVIPPFEIFEGL